MNVAAPAIPPIGDLRDLLDARRATELLCSAGWKVRGARPVWWRAPGGRSATVLYDLAVEVDGDPVLARGYAKTWCGDEAPAVADKWSRLKPALAPDGGPGTGILPGSRSVFFHFPNDGGLRLMREAVDLDRLKRRLTELGGPFAPPWRVRGSRSSLAVVRWKPEHRCVARLALALKDDDSGEKRDVEAYVRIFDDETGAGLFRLLSELRGESAAAHLPLPLGALAEGRIYVEAAIAGEGQKEAILRGAADGREFGRVLALLHGAQVSARRTDPRALLEHRIGELEAVRAIDDDLARALAARFAESTSDPVGDAFLHGDLHPEQCIISGRGSVLIDFERAARGDPLTDVGNYVAHLLTLQDDPLAADRVRRFTEDFLAGYRENARPFTERALARATAVGLVQWAATRHRHRILEPTNHLDRALSSALAILDRGTIA